MKDAGRTATAEKVVRIDGVEIATEAFGDPAHPPVLLIMGAMASMLWWPDEFCRQLAARGRFVVRYDHRDTGLSTHSEPGHPDYTSTDMAEDTLRVLDGYSLPSTHFVGMSAGGAIVQTMALDHPDRVLSLTAISTSPIRGAGRGLPPSTPAYQAHAVEGEGIDWSDREQAVSYTVKEMRALAGNAQAFDAAAARAFVERDYDRSGGFASATNHFILEDGADEPKRPLGALQVPLLVIHGAADPLLPVEHGEALARAVPQSKLLRLEGGGHELNETHWPQIIAAIVEHTEHLS